MIWIHSHGRFPCELYLFGVWCSMFGVRFVTSYSCAFRKLHWFYVCMFRWGSVFIRFKHSLDSCKHVFAVKEMTFGAFHMVSVHFPETVCMHFPRIKQSGNGDKIKNHKSSDECFFHYQNCIARACLCVICAFLFSIVPHYSGVYILHRIEKRRMWASRRQIRMSFI